MLPLQGLSTDTQEVGAFPFSFLPAGQVRQKAGLCAALQLAQLGSHTVKTVNIIGIEIYEDD